VALELLAVFQEMHPELKQPTADVQPDTPVMDLIANKSTHVSMHSATLKQPVSLAHHTMHVNVRQA